MFVLTVVADCCRWRQHSACCEKALACCHSASVGVSVAVGESEKTGYSRLATVAIGDPNNIQVHIASCNAAQLDRSDPEKPPCELTAVVLPGYDRDTDKWRRESQFAQSVGVGGYQAILVADAGQDCQYLAAGEGCGVVCEVPACSPGHCLMYDFSTDTDFCQKCTKPQECPGGIQSCEKMTNNTLWAMALSFFFFMLLFVCLYALSAWARGATALEILSEVCCCGLLRYVAGLQVPFNLLVVALCATSHEWFVHCMLASMPETIHSNPSQSDLVSGAGCTHQLSRFGAGAAGGVGRWERRWG